MRLGFDQGENTSAPREELAAGEMVRTVGIEYRPGDKRPWTMRGRSSFGDTGGAAKVKGVALCKFDTGGNDKVAALVDTVLYGATPGATGTFASLKTGLSASATRLVAAHALDRWYLANGVDRNLVLSSDGTVRNHGMISPQEATAATAGTGSGTLGRPTAETGDFTSPGSAYDGSLTTYAYATLSAAGSQTSTWHTWSTPGSGARDLIVSYRLIGQAPRGDDGDVIGIGGLPDSGYSITLTFDLSENYSTTQTFTTKKTQTFTAYMSQFGEVHIPVQTGTAAADVAVKVTMTYNSGTTTGTLYIRDIKLQTDVPSGSTFTPTTGFYYCITEFDSTNGLESAPNQESEIITGAGINKVDVTLPSAAQNSNTTHFRIYRTSDGGTFPLQCGRIGEADVASVGGSFTDTFIDGATHQPYPLLRFFSVEASGATNYFYEDAAPPAFEHVSSFQGSIVGTRGRKLHYSVAGRPESFPEINVIASWDMPDRDVLVGTVAVGGALLCLAEQTVFRLDTLPRSVSGTFDASAPDPISGQPGCVGVKAFCSYSVAGEPRAAYVSRYGIIATDTHTALRLTDDIDWASGLSGADLSTSVLRWDQDRQALVFSYDSDGGGVNDRFALLHMAPEHRKQSGRPKITWGHYGNINDLVIGEVSGVQRIYSGHTSNGIVYLENSGTTDASNAYDSSGTIRVDFKTGRMYGPGRDWETYKATLRHTDAGSGQTVSVTWSTGWDESGDTQSTAETVSVSGQRGHDFLVNMAGEWQEVNVVYTGGKRFAFLGIDSIEEVQGVSGRAVS